MGGYYGPTSQRGLFASIWAWVIGCLVVGGILSAVGFGISWAVAPAKGKLQARQQINSGAFRIAAYDHFFDVCASVQNAEASLEAQEQELAAAGADDRSRILANIAGLRATRASAINQYNADAAKGYTEGQFRSSQLPYRLADAPYEKGAHTQCTA